MLPSKGRTLWKGDNDLRITSVGRWLRRTYLDEPPSAWNILRGEVTLVGPRPEPLPYVDELAEKLPWYHVRHRVRPSLTGRAQVKYACGANEKGALEKVQYEFYDSANRTSASTSASSDWAGAEPPETAKNARNLG